MAFPAADLLELCIDLAPGDLSPPLSLHQQAMLLDKPSGPKTRRRRLVCPQGFLNNLNGRHASALCELRRARPGKDGANIQLVGWRL
jgi:hypothetical protein